MYFRSFFSSSSSGYWTIQLSEISSSGTALQHSLYRSQRWSTGEGKLDFVFVVKSWCENLLILFSLQIEWHKDGRRLTPGYLPKTNVIQVTEYSLTLAFESVQPEHRGMCPLTNIWCLFIVNVIIILSLFYQETTVVLHQTLQATIDTTLKWSFTVCSLSPTLSLIFKDLLDKTFHKNYKKFSSISGTFYFFSFFFSLGTKWKDA